MGQAERARENRADAKRAEKRQRHFQSTQKVSVTDVDPELLLVTLAQVLAKNGALRIGCTRDGGAWAFGIYGDGPQPYTEYVRPAEDVNKYLAELGEFFAGLEAN